MAIYLFDEVCMEIENIIDVIEMEVELILSTAGVKDILRATLRTFFKLNQEEYFAIVQNAPDLVTA